jgi:hypothetical protein
MTEIELLAALGRAARTKSKTCCARCERDNPPHTRQPPGAHPRLIAGQIKNCWA